MPVLADNRCDREVLKRLIMVRYLALSPSDRQRFHALDRALEAALRSDSPAEECQLPTGSPNGRC